MRVIRPVCSACGMNSSGGMKPRFGSSQRISASSAAQPAGGEVVDRLVVQDELVLGERAAQARGERELPRLSSAPAL